LRQRVDPAPSRRWRPMSAVEGSHDATLCCPAGVCITRTVAAIRPKAVATTPTAWRPSDVRLLSATHCARYPAETHRPALGSSQPTVTYHAPSVNFGSCATTAGFCSLMRRPWRTRGSLVSRSELRVRSARREREPRAPPGASPAAPRPTVHAGSDDNTDSPHCSLPALLLSNGQCDGPRASSVEHRPQQNGDPGPNGPGSPVVVR
jgi:hypothetical protein